MILRAKISGIGVKLCGHHPEATYRSNIPPLWGATSASFEMSSYLHGCQPTMCKVTGHRPSRKVMSLNHITVVPGIGKPKYVHTYLQKNMPLAFRLALFFNFAEDYILVFHQCYSVCIDVKKWGKLSVFDSVLMCVKWKGEENYWFFVSVLMCVAKWKKSEGGRGHIYIKIGLHCKPSWWVK